MRGYSSASSGELAEARIGFARRGVGMRGVSPTGREEWGDEEEGGGEKPRQNLGRAGDDKGNIGGIGDSFSRRRTRIERPQAFLRELVLVCQSSASFIRSMIQVWRLIIRSIVQFVQLCQLQVTYRQLNADLLATSHNFTDQ
jgi:hypothetical protein